MSLSGLWTPDSARSGKTFTCTSCGGQWPEDQREQFRRHAIRCAEIHDAEAQEQIAAAESSPITSIEDKEEFAFIRKRARDGKKPTRGGRAA